MSLGVQEGYNCELTQLMGGRGDWGVTLRSRTDAGAVHGTNESSLP